MPLDLAGISSQVNSVGLNHLSEIVGNRADEARRQLAAQSPEGLRAKLAHERFRTSWLVGRPLTTLAGAYPLPPRPAGFRVVASDGSFIPPDRHNPYRYYVINTGIAALSYGEQPDARLTSHGRFFYADEDLYVPHDYKILPVEGARLSVKMALMELSALFHEAAAVPRPRIALRDGSLIFWALQGEEEEVCTLFLGDLVRTLDDFLGNHIPLVSYISKPDSRDVVNALRVGLCPDDPVSCDHCSTRDRKRDRACSGLAHLVDRRLFQSHLPAGHRSDLFRSDSPVLRRYGRHAIGFFYLNVGDEIGRVEAPAWVLEDRDTLDLVHALVFDQCRRGQGYPPALKEAHEQAVISGAERRVVEEMVEEAVLRLGGQRPEPRSAKDRHKRERGV